ncbi:Prolyl 4-hydroxylase 5 [Nymphaea thermarum]|nr:Prolyl 4-hydroxylase 5 [Nymphaea thermarum]
MCVKNMEKVFKHFFIGQEYEPHFDCFLDEFNSKNCGSRIAYSYCTRKNLIKNRGYGREG